MAQPDLNDPEAQRQYQQQQEQARQQAAAQQAVLDKQKEADNSGISGVVNGIWNTADDMFSAEQVSGPQGGSWGTSGSNAAIYNAGAAARGAQLNGSDARAAGELGNRAGYIQQRQAPTTNYAGADFHGAQADSSRTTAQGLTNQAAQAATQQRQLAALNNFANQGPGPSAAQAQLQAGSDAAQQSAMSMARSGRGAGDSASALRDASFQNANTQGNVAASAAQLRAQEDAAYKQRQLEALNSAMGGSTAIRGSDAAAAQLAQGTRAQDLAAQQQAAGQSQFRTQAQMQQTGLNDAAAGNLYNTGLGYRQLGQQGELQYAQLGQNALNSQADYELQQQQMAIDAAKANQSADLEKDSGVVGMIGSAAGALFSDERAKELEQRERSLAKALDTVGNAPGYSYKYKDPSAPGAKPGRMVGPMAQDIERGPLGETIVIDTPQGKMVDPGRLTMVNTSAITELNRRQEALERALSSRSHAR